MQINHKHFFISYTQQDKDFAFELVDILEKKGTRCFIAPRDIPSGEEYAPVLVKAIEDCDMVLLIASKASDESGYVRREINSAVSRHKVIIQIRIEDFQMSKAMEFYLGTTQWIDAFPRLLEEDVNFLVSRVTGEEYKKEVATVVEKKKAQNVKYKGIQVRKISEMLECGYKPEEITMREIEIDFEATPKNEYELTDETEGTLEDWADSLMVEECTSALLVEDDYIIGYCDAYPISDEVYKGILAGKIMMCDDLIDIFVLGGEFNLSIPAFMVTPEYINQRTYGFLFDWLFNHIAYWKNQEHIDIKNIVVSSYNDLLERMLNKLGFKLAGLNPVKGKLYVISKEELLEQSIIRKRYPQLFDKISGDN